MYETSSSPESQQDNKEQDQDIEEAIMAAHLFNEAGQLEEVDIPGLFEVLAGGESADEGTFKFLMEFADSEGDEPIASSAATAVAAAEDGNSVGVGGGGMSDGSATGALSGSSTGTDMNEMDLISSTDLDSVFDCQMLGPLETPPLDVDTPDLDSETAAAAAAAAVTLGSSTLDDAEMTPSFSITTQPAAQTAQLMSLPSNPPPPPLWEGRRQA